MRVCADGVEERSVRRLAMSGTPSKRSYVSVSVSAASGGGESGGSAKSTASETPAGGHGVSDEWRVPGVHGKGAAGVETRCAT